MDGFRHVSLRAVSHQNHLAAVKIQKVQRGHRQRLQLWRYGGKLMIAQVAKIQRCYRGLQGRRVAAEVYRCKVLRCAHKIQGLYYRWHSRRLRLRSHLNFLNRGVVLLQSYFRMRAAIRFSNVIRRALHNKKAGMIQRQARRMIGLRKSNERRKRFHYIYNHLLKHIRAAIQSLSSVSTEVSEMVTDDPDSPLFLLTDRDEGEVAQPSNTQQYQKLTHKEKQVEAFDSVLCNLLALSRYDVVRQIGACMSLAVHTIGTEQRGATSYSAADIVGGMPGCVGNEAELALTAAYLGLSACWTRAGKMRFTRADYMEEALGLMMQHSAVALVKAQRRVQLLASDYSSGAIGVDEPLASPGDSCRSVSRPHNADSADSADSTHLTRHGDSVVPFAPSPMINKAASLLPSDPDTLPAWLLAMEEASVDLYYMAILAMKGVTSPYDAMILLADWVWHQACVHEHNAAAEDLVLLQAAAIRDSIRAKRAIAEESKDGTVDSNSNQKALPQPTGPLSLADLVAAQASGQLQPVQKEVEAYIDPAYAEHARRQQEGAFRHRFAVRRVYGLLHRARKLLSAESRDRREISDRLDVFHDLHMTEHRALLVDCKAFPFPYRAHYYTQQESIERQRIASAAVASAKLSRFGNGLGREQAVSAWSAEQSSSGELEVDVQIILCGKTVLIKGTVLLHRLVEATDDLPVGCARMGPSDERVVVEKSRRANSKGQSRKNNKSSGQSSKHTTIDSLHGDRKGREAPVLVAVRPFVLLRAEVAELVDLINEELGILDIVGAAAAGGGGADDGSETNSLGGSSTAGSLSQTETMSQSQTTASGAPDDHQHKHKQRHSHNHHGFSQAEYQRLGEYLQRNLRLVSCQDSFVDPSLAALVREMRATVRERLKHDKYMYGARDGGLLEASCIEPGVPNVRFALPVVEYKRRIFNDSQTVVHATHLLQRVYRGFRGRAKFRRMRWKRNEFERQARHTLDIRAEHDTVRFWRGERLTVIQRLFRGYRWRKRLCALRCASLVVQCAYRMFHARKVVHAERRRRVEGAPVVSMLGNGRGVQVGDVKFTLKVFRSGTNYRLEGLDLLRGVVYEGAVYTPEVMRLIQGHNAGIKGSTLLANSQRIMPWQHERVTELIISNLGLMPKIAALATQLGARTSAQPAQYILVTNKYASTTVPPVQPPPSAQQLHGSVSQPILELATAHTQKQRLQRYAQFRQDSRLRRQPLK